MSDDGTGDGQYPGWVPPPVPPFLHGQPPQGARVGQIKRQPGLQGRGMAIAGVVLGWVGVAVIVLGVVVFVASGTVTGIPD